MAFTAIGAIIAGEAVTATVVLAAVAEVGLALTVVGAVTGNKTLIKIGGAMSLIGGVGGLVAGAVSGAAGGAAAGAAEGAAGEAATGAAVDAASAEAAAAYGGAAAAEASTADVVAGMEAGATTAAPELASAASAAPSGIVDSAASTTPMAQATPSAMETAPQLTPTANEVATPQAPVGAQGPATPYDTPNPTDQRLAAGVQASPSNAPETAGSYFGRLTTFAEKNKTLFSSGMQLVGGAMKGANERDMWNQKMELERQRLAQTQYGNQVGQFRPRGIVQGASQ
jgi:hypothetical protein